jgi:hypothetical protein
MAILRLFLLLLLFPALAQAVDLSGQWRGDDGGEYYLVQRDSSLYWYAERSATAPAWAHIFDGRIRGERVRGKWNDVPKGTTRGHGELELELREGGNVLAITRKSGGFGGTSLTRVGYVRPMESRPMAPMTPPMQPALPPTTQVRPMPMPMTPALQEDCIAFSWQNAARRQIGGRWKIVDGSHWMFDFGDNGDEAEQALRIIKRYRLDSSCFVGRPDPSFSYLLSGGQAPSGGTSGEDCISFNPGTATVEQHGGRWKVVDGSHWMFDFDANEGEARQALAIIKKYGFTRSCFVGRPDPSFTYLRR